MSIENVQAFIDASKRSQNNDAFATLSASDGSDEAIVSCGNQLGFEFDLSDLEAFMQSHVQEAASRLDEGELTEGELAAVAGGSSCGNTMCSLMPWFWCC